MIPQPEWPEVIGKWVSEKGPESHLEFVYVLEVGSVGERRPNSAGYAELGHGGFDLVVADIAAVTGNVAVIGEGIDDGTRAAEVGGGGRLKLAFLEGRGALVEVRFYSHSRVGYRVLCGEYTSYSIDRVKGYVISQTFLAQNSSARAFVVLKLPVKDSLCKRGSRDEI